VRQGQGEPAQTSNLGQPLASCPPGAKKLARLGRDENDKVACSPQWLLQYIVGSHVQICRHLSDVVCCGIAFATRMRVVTRWRLPKIAAAQTCATRQRHLARALYHQAHGIIGKHMIGKRQYLESSSIITTNHIASLLTPHRHG
jgi:hypothetical protein